MRLFAASVIFRNSLGSPWENSVRPVFGAFLCRWTWWRLLSLPWLTLLQIQTSEHRYLAFASETACTMVSCMFQRKEVRLLCHIPSCAPGICVYFRLGGHRDHWFGICVGRATAQLLAFIFPVPILTTSVSDLILIQVHWSPFLVLKYLSKSRNEEFEESSRPLLPMLHAVLSLITRFSHLKVRVWNSITHCHWNARFSAKTVKHQTPN